MVNHHIPSTLQEALKILDKHDCYIMAGGTDLMVVKHQRSGIVPNFDKDVCYIANLEELQYIFEDEKGVHIGAGTKFSDIEVNELVPEILKQIIHELASPNIRNMATMAGNIANESPAGDSIVGLYLLDAELELVNIHGSRMVPIKDFIFGVRKIHRNQNELIKEIFIPHHDDLNTYWRKVGSRAAESISRLPSPVDTNWKTEKSKTFVWRLVVFLLQSLEKERLKKNTSVCPLRNYITMSKISLKI